jgi:hypothetical protein
MAGPFQKASRQLLTEPNPSSLHSRKSAQWARKWYHYIILGNVITVMLFSTGCGLWDQLSLPPDKLVSRKFSRTGSEGEV